MEQYYGDGLREVAEAYWDASTSEASERNKRAISEKYADQPDEIKEEYLVSTLAKNMTTGNVDKLIERLSPEHQEIINNILKSIGYDRAKEAERRKQAGKEKVQLGGASQEELQIRRSGGGIRNGKEPEKRREPAPAVQDATNSKEDAAERDPHNQEHRTGGGVKPQPAATAASSKPQQPAGA